MALITSGLNLTASAGFNCCTEAIPEEYNLTTIQGILAAAIMTTYTLFIVVSNLGIVYYHERLMCNHYRTPLNRLAALVSLYQVCLAAVPLPIMAYRVLVGRGLSDAVCHLGFAIIIFSLTQMVLAYNETVVLRYIYICKLGTVGTIKEDLIEMALTCLNLVIGTFSSLALTLVHYEVSPEGYEYCTNVKMMRPEGTY